MRNSLSLAMAAGLALPMCAQAPEQALNPFFQTWQTPFGVPPFAQIKEEHYLPAFKEGMARQKKEIAEIVDSGQAPDFRNTIEALDDSGRLLNRISAVFYALLGAETSPGLQAIAQEVAPLLSAHGDDISLNEKLWTRVKAVWENRAKEKLSPEQTRLLDLTYKGFVRSGANLGAEQKTKLRAINEEDSVLEVQFGNKLLKATNDYRLVIDKKADLAGLPEGLVAAAAEAADKANLKGKWVFTLHSPSIWPFLQYAENRDLRRQILTAYLERCSPSGDTDTKTITSRLASLRVEKAQLLGFKTWADFVLEERMAKNSARVYGLLEQIWKPSLQVAKKELAELQAMADSEKAGIKIESWDWRFYAEKVRKAKYALDEEAIRPFFSLEKVREGAFHVANKLYGVTFTELKGMPVYHPEVKVFEVKEKDGSHLGVLYVDYHPRPTKSGGAWCGSFQDAWVDGGRKVEPIITNVCNFSRPNGNTPALLNADEVSTLFHEFGHALHGLFYAGRYRGVAGTPSDFVELPSQIMERWCMEPEVLKVYARHYRTGESIPQALIEKIQKAGKYGQGFATVEFMAACLLDLDWHTLTDTKPQDTLAFEKASLAKWGLMPEIPVRYRSPYFSHIWDGGYSAGYYGYLWCEVLDTDAFQAFKEKGNLFDPATAKAFRDKVLSKGGSEEPIELYKNFRGREPRVEPLLERRGLK